MRWMAVVGLLIPGVASLAQDSLYTPGHTYNWKSKTLLARLNGQVRSELERNSVTLEMPMAKHYRDIADDLRRKVRDSSFLDYRDIQWLLDETYWRLRESNRGLTPTPKTILAFRHPFPNAYCMGEGTFLVATGLLSRIQNQSQLAAILAHELAHYELNHVWKSIQVVEAAKARTKGSSPPGSGDPTVDKVRELQQLTTYVYKTHQEWEFQADSLGFIYFSNAGFSHAEFLTMLAVLDPEVTAADNSPTSFFAPLNFSRYPFKEVWLRPRAAVYGKSPWDFFLPEEVMRTHPQLVRRAEKLLPHVRDEGLKNFVQPSVIQKVADAALLESTAAGSRIPLLDLAFHENLFALNRLPRNPHLVSAMGRTLLRSVGVKRDNTLIYHLPIGTTGYDSRMLLVYNLLNNITARELSEMGYHFMNLKENFNEDVEEHYFLLWKFCQLTERSETQKGVKAEYLARFPKGRYARHLK